MAEEKKVFLKALKRFNHHNPGDVFEATEVDAAVWIKEKLCEKSGPPADKAEKGAQVQK